MRTWIGHIRDVRVVVGRKSGRVRRRKREERKTDSRTDKFNFIFSFNGALKGGQGGLHVVVGRWCGTTKRTNEQSNTKGAALFASLASPFCFLSQPRCLRYELWCKSTEIRFLQPKDVPTPRTLYLIPNGLQMIKVNNLRRARAAFFFFFNKPCFFREGMFTRGFRQWKWLLWKICYFFWPR